MAESRVLGCALGLLALTSVTLHAQGPRRLQPSGVTVASAAAHMAPGVRVPTDTIPLRSPRPAWQSIALGTLIGAGAGFVIGFAVDNAGCTNDNPDELANCSKDKKPMIIVGGALIGGLVGWLIHAGNNGPPVTRVPQ